MSDVVERAKAVLDGKATPSASLCAELVAEIESLHSWDGLMSLLDEHYPEDIFPTEEDQGTRDPGPRIISLLRTVDQLRGIIRDLEAQR